MRPLFSERRFSRVSNTRLGYRCRQLEPDWAAHQLCLLKDVLQSVLGQDSIAHESESCDKLCTFGITAASL